jgi:hypothetical protein
MATLTKHLAGTEFDHDQSAHAGGKGKSGWVGQTELTEEQRSTQPEFLAGTTWTEATRYGPNGGRLAISAVFTDEYLASLGVDLDAKYGNAEDARVDILQRAAVYGGRVFYDPINGLVAVVRDEAFDVEEFQRLGDRYDGPEPQAMSRAVSDAIDEWFIRGMPREGETINERGERRVKEILDTAVALQKSAPIGPTVIRIEPPTNAEFNKTEEGPDGEKVTKVAWAEGLYYKPHASTKTVGDASYRRQTVQTIALSMLNRFDDGYFTAEPTSSEERQFSPYFSTLVHEWGHAIGFQSGRSDAQREALFSAYKRLPDENVNGFVTEYGLTNSREMEAEAFTSWFMHKNGLDWTGKYQYAARFAEDSLGVSAKDVEFITVDGIAIPVVKRAALVGIRCSMNPQEGSLLVYADGSTEAVNDLVDVAKHLAGTEFDHDQSAHARGGTGRSGDANVQKHDPELFTNLAASLGLSVDMTFEEAAYRSQGPAAKEFILSEIASRLKSGELVDDVLFGPGKMGYYEELYGKGSDEYYKALAVEMDAQFRAQMQGVEVRSVEEAAQLSAMEEMIPGVVRQAIEQGKLDIGAIEVQLAGAIARSEAKQMAQQTVAEGLREVPQRDLYEAYDALMRLEGVPTLKVTAGDTPISAFEAVVLHDQTTNTYKIRAGNVENDGEMRMLEVVGSVGAQEGNVVSRGRLDDPEFAETFDNAVRSQIARDMIGNWAISSNRGALAATIQRAAEAEFGLEGAAEPAEGARDGALERVAREFVRSQYSATQELLAREMPGVTHLRLFRGGDSGARYVDEPDDVPSTWEEGTLRLRPLASFTTAPTVANLFGIDSNALYFAADVPVERILSTPFTGIGASVEAEFVVLGGPIHGLRQAQSITLNGSKWAIPNDFPVGSTEFIMIDGQPVPVGKSLAKHLAGTEYDHDQSAHAGGGGGTESGAASGERNVKQMTGAQFAEWAKSMGVSGEDPSVAGYDYDLHGYLLDEAHNITYEHLREMIDYGEDPARVLNEEAWEEAVIEATMMHGVSTEEVNDRASMYFDEAVTDALNRYADEEEFHEQVMERVRDMMTQQDWDKAYHRSLDRAAAKQMAQKAVSDGMANVPLEDLIQFAASHGNSVKLYDDLRQGSQRWGAAQTLDDAIRAGKNPDVFVSETGEMSIGEAASERIGGVRGKFNDPDVQEAISRSLRDGIAYGLIKAWAETSNKTSVAETVQNAVAREFGISDVVAMPGSGYQGETAKRVAQAFVRAQYEATQAMLAEQFPGVTHFTLFRGGDSDIRYSDIDSTSDGTGYNEGTLVNRPLASFSTSAAEANAFTNGAGTFVAAVPVERIFSTPFTGNGALIEAEFVVLGGPIRGQRTKGTIYYDYDGPDMPTSLPMGTSEFIMIDGQPVPIGKSLAKHLAGTEYDHNQSSHAGGGGSVNFKGTEGFKSDAVALGWHGIVARAGMAPSADLLKQAVVADLTQSLGLVSNEQALQFVMDLYGADGFNDYPLASTLQDYFAGGESFVPDEDPEFYTPSGRLAQRLADLDSGDPVVVEAVIAVLGIPFESSATVSEGALPYERPDGRAPDMVLFKDDANGRIEDIQFATTPIERARMAAYQEAIRSWRLAGAGEIEDIQFLRSGDVERGSYKDVLREHIADRAVATWAETSNKAVLSQALQAAIREEFGLQSERFTNESLRAVADAGVELFNNHREIFGPLVRRQYEQTQQFLRDVHGEDVTHIRLYRGRNWQGSLREDSQGRLVPATIVDTNPLSSWSSDVTTALQFAGWSSARGTAEGRHAAVESLVPIERIFSTPATGVGALGEREHTVLGGRLPVDAVMDVVYTTFGTGGGPFANRTQSDVFVTLPSGQVIPLEEYTPTPLAKHLAGTEFDHDQSNHSGGKGASDGVMRYDPPDSDDIEERWAYQRQFYDSILEGPLGSRPNMSGDSEESQMWNRQRDMYVAGRESSEDIAVIVNRALRAGEVTSTGAVGGDQWQRVRVFDEMVNSTAKQDFQVFRSAVLTQEQVDSLRAGIEFIDPGFQSSDLNESMAMMYGFNRWAHGGRYERGMRDGVPVLFRMVVKKGTGAVDVSYGEIVIQRNARVRVMSDPKVGEPYMTSGKRAREFDYVGDPDSGLVYSPNFVVVDVEVSR